MINLSTPNEELLEELKSDYNRVVHWFSTKRFTSRRLRQNAYVLERKCIDNDMQFATGEPEEFLTKNGNKWIIFQKARRCEGEILPEIQTFCFYNTLGSAGAFVPSFVGGKIDSCVIFTSHFFLRLKQRLGLEYVNKDVIQRFIEYIGSFHSESLGEGKHGKNEVIIYLNGAVGYGVFRDENCNILEVKSFLKETELTRFQQRQVKNVKRISSGFIDMPFEAMKKKVNNGSLDEIRVYEHNLKLKGSDPDKFDKGILMLGSVIMIAKEYGLSLDNTEVADWIHDNYTSYPSIARMLDDHGWDFDHSEFGVMAKDAMRALGGITPPVVGFDVKVETWLYMVKDMVIEEMNKRRSKY